jgi:hypothetical protein
MTGSFSSRYASARQPGPSASRAASLRPGSGAGAATRSPSSQPASPRQAAVSLRAAPIVTMSTVNSAATPTAAATACPDGFPSATHGGPEPSRNPASTVAKKPASGMNTPNGSVRTQNATSRRARPVNGPHRTGLTKLTASINSLSRSRVPAAQQPAADHKQHHGIAADDAQPGPRRRVTPPTAG